MRRPSSPPIHHAQRQEQATTATTISRPARTALTRLVGFAVLLAACAWPSTASAAPTTPSTAHQLQIGVPWSSLIERAPDPDWAAAWLRLPEPLNPGDKVTFASDADYGITYCLVPAVDDFGATDAERRCERDYSGPGYVYLGAGKWRRTLKWAHPSSQGFLVAGAFSFARPVTYSVLLERIDRYEPDFTAPAVEVLDRRAKVTRRGAARVRIVCPADEVSPPCRGSALVTTRGKVRVGKSRRVLLLGRATFSLGADETATITLRLKPRRVRIALRGRKSIQTHLIVRAIDKANNRSAQRFNLRLARR